MALSLKKKNSEYIICCKCGDTQSFSRDAFKLLFPGRDLPEQYLQPDLHKLVDKLNKNSNFCKYITENLLNGKNKFSYYFSVDSKGNVVEQYNLLTGKKVI